MIARSKTGACSGALLGALVAAAQLVGPNAAWSLDVVDDCGQFVRTSGRPTADLDCSAVPGTAVVLGRGALLFLAGFTIHGEPGSDVVRCEGECTVRGPGTVRGGVYGIYGVGPIRVSKATVSENRSVGIFSDLGVSVRDSTVTLNGGEGILNFEGSTAVRGSEVSYNGAYGVSGEFNVRVDDSVIVGNYDSGIDSFDGRVRVRRSEIRDNLYDGIVAYEAVTVTDSVIEGNDGSGIYALKVRLRDSIVSRQTFDGVTADEEAIVRSSLIEGNHGAGVYSYDRARVSGSTIRANLSGGVASVTASISRSVVIDNTCADSFAGCGDVQTVEEPIIRDSECERSVRASSARERTRLAPGEGTFHTVTLRLVEPVAVGGLIVEVSYGASGGRPTESAGTILCDPVEAWGVGFVLVDHPTQTLTLAAASLFGIVGPSDVAVCSFSAAAGIDPDGFVVSVLDASTPAAEPLVPLPEVDVIVDEFVPDASLATWGVCAHDSPQS